MTPKASWPPKTTMPARLPPVPGVRVPPYTTCCPHCGGVHMKKVQFLDCRTGVTGR